MSPPERQPTDLRRYRRQLERRLLVAVVVSLVVVGSLLIGVIFGWPAALTSLACLVPGALVVVTLWLLLKAIEHLVAER